MNISFNLASNNGKRSPLRIIITHQGKVYRKSCGITVETAQWSKTKQRASDIETNKRIATLRKHLEDCLGNFPSQNEIEIALMRINKGEWTDGGIVLGGEHPTFMQHFKEWSERECSSKRQHRSAYKTFISLTGGFLDWNDMTDQVYNRMLSEMKRRGFATNYAGNLIQRVKVVMSEGYKEGWHTNTAYQKWQRITEPAFSIALNEKEMQMLWDAELTGHEAAVRDLAWVGYLTASRYSDYSRITTDNIKENSIRFVQRKTDRPVLIPCSPKMIAILERNGGHAPRMAQQTFNRDIKTVCRKAGITDIVEVPKSFRSIKGWDMSKKVEKWELVSSHCFRRSGATALYRSGVPARVVRYLTGHTSDKQLFKYIKIDMEEGLDLLSQSDFFK